MSDHAYDIPQIGMTRTILNGQGINNVNDIAEQYLIQQNLLKNNNEWAHDRYLIKGSAAIGDVASAGGRIKHNCTIWSINHYLALNRHPYVMESAINAIRKYGTGCGTSAMSGGHNELHKSLQERLALFFNKEDAILFPTGFTANSGAISTLCRDPKTLILFDRDCHASIIDGCKMSGSKFLPFKHNSILDLERKLTHYHSKYDNIFVIVESVYSMGGDVTPLEDIVRLKNKFKFLLYIDESHSFGIYGNQGRGLAQKLSLENDVDFIMTTLSKSTASIGGVIAASKSFCSMLRWSNAYLFQASIPAADAASIHACLDLFEKENAGVDELWGKVAYFREKALLAGFDIGSGESPIIPVYIRNSKTLKQMEKDLFDNGVFTLAIQYPVVKKSEVRFRFIVNSSHSISNIDFVIELLTTLGVKYEVLK